jgi:L-malate glycosyltransferase
VSYNIMPHGVNGFISGRLTRTRTLYHMIGGEIEWNGGGWQSENAILGRLPRPLPPLERALLGVIRRTDAVCTMGSKARDRLLEAGVEPRRIFVTPPSVDTERFSPNGVPTPAYDVLTAGRLVPIKRFDDYIAVISRLRERRPDIRAAISGTGPLEQDLRRRAKQAGVSDAIDFLGFRADIENVYRAARVFVLTSESEGLSVAMTEAMASGLPAVVTDVGDLGDLVEDSVNGYLLAVGDVDGIADRIARLLDDEHGLHCASDAARCAAVRHSGIEHLSSLYRRILGEPVEA